MVRCHNAFDLWFRGIQCEDACGVVVSSQLETVLLNDVGHTAVVIRVGATGSATPAMMVQELHCWHDWLQNNHSSGALAEYVLKPSDVCDLSSKLKGLIPLETVLKVQASGHTRLSANDECGGQSSWIRLDEI